MIKKIIISLGLLALIAAILIGIFLNWVKNPCGLEPERIGPKGDEKLPLITPTPNAKNYLLYSKYENNDYVIHLSLPNQYIHPSNNTKQIRKTYAVPATVYYPEINGKFHPDNSGLPKCNGWCNGYMRIVVESGKTAMEINNRIVDKLQKETSDISELRLFEDLDSEFELVEHFQVRFPIIEQKSDGNKYATDEYFIKRDRAGEIIHLVKCSPYKTSPGCEIKFNLSSHPEVLVSITFGRHLMKDWERIIVATDKKITRWGLTRIGTIVN